MVFLAENLSHGMTELRRRVIPWLAFQLSLNLILDFTRRPMRRRDKHPVWTCEAGLLLVNDAHDGLG